MALGIFAGAFEKRSFQSTLAWYGQVWCFSDESPKIDGRRNKFRGVPLYASAPIAYDGTVYARVDVARWSRACP